MYYVIYMYVYIGFQEIILKIIINVRLVGFMGYQPLQVI